MTTPTSRPGIPEQAKLVFKGIIFETWQWEQTMFDGSTTTFEKIWRVPTVEIIATVGDKIIIEHQDQPDRPGNINMPSGRADMSHDTLEEAKRELLEETGYTSDNWSLIRTEGGHGKVIHETYYYLAKNCTKIQEPTLDSGEKIEVELISFDEYVNLYKEPKFWVTPEFINFLLNLTIDPTKKEEFKKLLFI